MSGIYFSRKKNTTNEQDGIQGKVLFFVRSFPSTCGGGIKEMCFQTIQNNTNKKIRKLSGIIENVLQMFMEIAGVPQRIPSKQLYLIFTYKQTWLDGWMDRQIDRQTD